MKPQPTLSRAGYNSVWQFKGHEWHAPNGIMTLPDQPVIELCPYGRPGDRLWVRETWAEHPCAKGKKYPKGEGHMWGSPIYAATFGGGLVPKCEGFSPWKSPIHMPRWAARITLEIVRVDVDRLNLINELDAKAEGVDVGRRLGMGRIGMKSYREGFANLWDNIYQETGKRWETNPWVWVIEFRPVDSPGGGGRI
jgi:hypothetical protein